MRQQFLLAVKIARKYGTAIVIGHPYPVTTQFLAYAIPTLDEAGVQLMSASALLMLQAQEQQLLAVPELDYSEDG